MNDIPFYAVGEVLPYRAGCSICGVRGPHNLPYLRYGACALDNYDDYWPLAHEGGKTIIKRSFLMNHVKHPGFFLGQYDLFKCCNPEAVLFKPADNLSDNILAYPVRLDDRERSFHLKSSLVLTPSFVFYINGFGNSSAAKTESSLDLHPKMVVLFRNCILRSAGPNKHLELPEVIPVIVQEHLNLLMDSTESLEVSLELLEMFGMVPTSDIYDHGIPPRALRASCRGSPYFLP